MSRKVKGNVVIETTMADEVVTALREAGYWVERLHSGCVSTGGRLVYDLKSRGLPQVVLPALNGWIIVAVSHLGVGHANWMERAAKAGLRIALVRSVEEALEKVAQWTSS